MTGYAEIGVTSNFSFLRGASHPEELVQTAQKLGIEALGIADRNSVAGVVRAHSAAKEAGLKLLVGTRLVFTDGTPDILAYPQDREGWAHLCRLLSQGRLRGAKGECLLTLSDLLEWRDGLNLVVIPPPLFAEAPLAALLAQLSAKNPLWLAAYKTYRGDDKRRMARLMEISRATGAPLLAMNAVLYHAPERRSLQDILTCIREHVTIDNAGQRLEANAERHLKAPLEMARLFAEAPDALRQTLALSALCRFNLDEIKPDYPDETPPGFASPQEALEAFAMEGAEVRYPNGVPDKVAQALQHEIRVIGTLNYAPYFLTVHEIVRFARSQGILCQGRGSAANSAICYCLGITEVDPAKTDLLFERFVSKERGEPPDIDIDFEHERREEVIQYIYRRYGRACAALTAVTTCYRARSSIREVGKAFGLSDDITSRLAGTLWGSWTKPVTPERAEKAGLQPSDPRLALVLHHAAALIGFPRHLSQHVGGFVISQRRLDETVPIENAAMEDRTVIEWNKDDLDTLGLLKVDVLGLGMLSCLRRSLVFLKKHYGRIETLASLEANATDAPTYRMLGRADAIGVFQVESRAQMSMLPRLKPAELYDLVVEVAIVRPGPIQGKMVHPYLRRRMGHEAPDYGPNDQLYDILHKTCGVPLFQEQAMRIAIVAAGYSAPEADKLRRAMASFRHTGTINSHRDKFIAGMLSRGYPLDFAENCFRQIEGFGDYGFPESHAYSFALLAYASAWLKCHYPDVFAASLINSQPMGFYAPAQIVRDVREHGIPVRPADINHSDWDCTLEHAKAAIKPPEPQHGSMAKDIRSTHAIRLGLRQIKGIGEKEANTLSQERNGGYDSVRDLWLRTGLPPATLETLAKADAFASLGLSRRDALWAVRALRRSGDKEDLPLFRTKATPEQEPDAALPAMPPGKEVLEDYRSLHLSLKAHPVSFLRHELARRRIVAASALRPMASGRLLTLAGLVLVRQRPGTANGVIFLTVEDETGIGNIIIWPKTFETYRAIVLSARLIGITGRLQKQDGVTHVIAERIEDLSPLLQRLSETGETAEGAMPQGRNFH